MHWIELDLDQEIARTKLPGRFHAFFVYASRMDKTILVCGGAGYIGSHMVRLLVERGLGVVVFEDISTGHDGFHAFNLGNGRGFSVLEVIRAAEKVTGREIPFETAGRRPGDPAVLVAASDRAANRLGWRPEIADLETIIRSAWEWERSRAF